MSSNFDYAGARNAGYSDDEIQDFLKTQTQFRPTNTGSFFENIMNNLRNFSEHLRKDPEISEQSGFNESIDPRLLKKHPNFDYEGAIESGYSPAEVNEFLQDFRPERSLGEQAGRIATQFGLGLAEAELLPYELGVAPLASEEAQIARYREDVGEDIERLLEQKSTGVWDDQDQALLDHLTGQIQDPEKAREFVQTADIGIRGLAEKATGMDLQPEGALEKAAAWVGFLKDPKKIAELSKTGFGVKDVIKAIAPTGKEALRGIGAGTALEIAEDGDYGPLGTLAAAVIGDVIGGGAADVGKGVKKLITQPKKAIAEAATRLTPKDKLDLQKQLIKDFRESGVQADLGTITDNNLIRGLQARLSQSQLTGKAFDEFKQELTGQITREYKNLAEQLGESRFATQHEAGEVLRDAIKGIRDKDLAETRQIYEDAKNSLRKDSFVPPHRLGKLIDRLETELKPGSIKSTEQRIVLDKVEELRRDITDSEGRIRFANVKDLINNKIALNDAINYEAQGGAKQLLKSIVGELDRAIISHGKDNPTFAKNYIRANKRFADHAKTFRNRPVQQMINTIDPATLLNRMNSVQGIRDIEKILKKTPEGKNIFNDLKRMKLDQTIGKNLTDSTTQQVKLGTFSKLLEKGKNREVIKEILGGENFRRLEKLQKNAGKLAESAQKFFNASQSGVAVIDAGLIMKTMNDVVSVLHGNPWPLARTAGILAGGKGAAKLLTDPEFLKLAEEAILASDRDNVSQIIDIYSRMRPVILESQLNQ